MLSLLLELLCVIVVGDGYRLSVHTDIERVGVSMHCRDVVQEDAELLAKLVDGRSFQKLDNLEYDGHGSRRQGLCGGVRCVPIADGVAEDDDVHGLCGSRFLDVY